MQSRLTFFLALGSTFAIGLYGVMGALYVEFLKEDFQRDGKLLAVLITAALAVASLTFGCFQEAYMTTKKED
jgi:hypothetical protein